MSGWALLRLFSPHAPPVVALTVKHRGRRGFGREHCAKRATRQPEGFERGAWLALGGSCAAAEAIFSFTAENLLLRVHNNTLL